MSPIVTKNGSSLQVILPKYLCETEGIEAGDKVNIKSSRGKIIVQPEERTDEAFTIGYESRTIDVFIEKLKSKGIKQLIDVRAIPLSRKKGFSKVALCERLASEKIKYIHMPSLGSPKDIRDNYKAGGSPQTFFSEYSAYLEGREDDLAMLLWHVKSEVSVLMCFELSYKDCHRKILASKLNEKDIHFTHL